MNIHEYQAKDLMKKFGIKVLGGQVAHTVDEASRISDPVARFRRRDRRSDCRAGRGPLPDHRARPGRRS